ncbi:urease accessory protein F [Tanacetum coccineum]
MGDKTVVNECTNQPSSTESDSLLQWSKWQLIDSILPTGGFAHSFGLEAATQSHVVSHPEDLQTYVIHVLENTGSLLLPFVYTTTTSLDFQTWQQLDMIPSLKTMRSVSLSNGDVRFHHAPIFGLVCGLLGFDSETSKRAYMFITMRDIISVATRLNLVGPLGAAVLKHQVTFVAEELLKKWKNRGVDEGMQISHCSDMFRDVLLTSFKTFLFMNIEATVNHASRLMLDDANISYILLMTSKTNANEL